MGRRGGDAGERRFAGTTAEEYARHRPGYPSATVDALVAALAGAGISGRAPGEGATRGTPVGLTLVGRADGGPPPDGSASGGRASGGSAPGDRSPEGWTRGTGAAGGSAGGGKTLDDPTRGGRAAAGRAPDGWALGGRVPANAALESAGPHGGVVPNGDAEPDGDAVPRGLPGGGSSPHGDAMREVSPIGGTTRGGQPESLVWDSSPDGVASAEGSPLGGSVPGGVGEPGGCPLLGGPVLDLACGTGLLTLPLAARAPTVLGADPEPDMLWWARNAAGQAGVSNVVWLVASDSDLPAIAAVVGEAALAAATIANAAHYLDTPVAFEWLAKLLRPGGAVAVIENGAPLWLAEVEWARAVRAVLVRWLGPVDNANGTDEDTRARYRAELAAAGLVVEPDLVVPRTETVDAGTVVGRLQSALSTSQIADADRPKLAAELREALLATDPAGTYEENVTLRAIIARRPA